MTRKGMFNRIPVDLHAELTRRAAEQDVSLNLLVVSLLAGAVGFQLEGSPRGEGNSRQGSTRGGEPSNGC